MNEKVYGIRTVICEKCGQTFIPAAFHRYKAGGKYYCKWTCFNHRNDPITKEETAYEDNKDRPTERA